MQPVRFICPDIYDNIIKNMEYSLSTIVEKDKTKSYLIHQYETKVIMVNYKNLWYECVAPLYSIETFRELKEEVL